MSLNKLLQSREKAIIERWLRRIVETYPDKTAVFLKRKRNQFENPVGHILTSNVEIIFQKFLEGADLEEFSTPLNEIVRVRSVQGFSPSQAISFVYLLKDVIRCEARDQVQDRSSFDELTRIEDRIDELACEAFDLYMRSREQIYELRVNEVKRTGFRLLQKAEIIGHEVKSDPALT
jgi:hypothetical protein